MEQQNKENIQDQVNVVTPTAQQTRQNSTLIIVLSVLLLISISTTVFFAYQTQSLVKELTEIKNNQQPTPVATTETSETTQEQTSTGSGITGTEDWKTYDNTSSNYEIAYPDNWVVENVAAGSMGGVTPDARYIQISSAGSKYGIFGIEELQTIPPSEEASLNSTKVVGKLTLRCNGNFTSDTKTWCWVKVPNQDKYLNIQVFKSLDSEVNKTLDQILSTFKFTN